MLKNYDVTITTVGDLQYALEDVKDDVKLYAEDYNTETLVEITEIFLVLPKNEKEDPYVVLRCR